MNIIIVDDEVHSIYYLKSICKEIKEIQVIGEFINPEEALKFICNKTNVDLVFLDIEMPGMSGIEFSKKIREISEEIAIIFVTAHEEYALDAFKLDAVSYILKPSELSEVERALKKAKQLMISTKRYVFIRTFEKFDIFINEEPVYFKNSKAKELLAILVDRRGGTVGMEEICFILWPNRPYDENVKQLYRKAISYINKIFKEKNIDIFVSNRGSCYVNPTKFKCDLYELINGNQVIRKEFKGEYMSEYDWAEGTLGALIFKQLY